MLRENLDLRLLRFSLGRKSKSDANPGSFHRGRTYGQAFFLPQSSAASQTLPSRDSFAVLPKDHTGLCQRYVPRPLHDAADYATVRQAIEPLLGFEDRLNVDQADYLEAVSSFIEAYDQTRVKWPKGKPLEMLRFLLEQHDLSAADLSRVLGSDRSLGSKLLRGDRRLTVDHIRMNRDGQDDKQRTPDATELHPASCPKREQSSHLTLVCLEEADHVWMVAGLHRKWRPGCWRNHL